MDFTVVLHRVGFESIPRRMSRLTAATRRNAKRHRARRADHAGKRSGGARSLGCAAAPGRTPEGCRGAAWRENGKVVRRAVPEKLPGIFRAEIPAPSVETPALLPRKERGRFAQHESVRQMLNDVPESDSGDSPGQVGARASSKEPHSAGCRDSSSRMHRAEETSTP